MDRLRWYIDGNIARTKSQVGGTYKVFEDVKPLAVHLTCRVAGKGTLPTEVDILDDGVSIFDQGKPVLLPGDTEKTWTTLSGNTVRQGSIITLDITGINDVDTCRDLTVELEVE